MKAIPTFQSVAQEWLKIKLPTLSNAKHQLQVENTLERYVFPAIGRFAVDAIPRTKLIAVVQAAQTGGNRNCALSRWTDIVTFKPS